MKTVLFILLVLGIIAFLIAIIFAFFAGIAATKSALDQAYEDQEQIQYLEKWQKDKD